MASLKPDALKSGALTLAVAKAFVRPVPAWTPENLRVVAFPRNPSRGNRFSMRDRIELEQWSIRMSRDGISRVRLEEAEPEDPSEVGSFVLLYRDGECWASWGIAACGPGGYEVWSMRSGATIGLFASLAEALERVPPA